MIGSGPPEVGDGTSRAPEIQGTTASKAKPSDGIDFLQPR